VVETEDGWVVLDVNDFPSFGGIPDAAERLARSVLRMAHRAAATAAAASTPETGSATPAARTTLAMEVSA
jgi:ribosomal protein S6--L-glutamate ligase